MSRLTLICAALTCAARVAAQDQILASDSFDTYTAGTLTTTATTAGGNAFSGGTGWKIGEGWFLQNVTGNGGSVATVSTGNLELRTSGTGSPATQDGFIGRQLASPLSPTDSAPIWFSCKIWPELLQAAGGLVSVTHDSIEFHNGDYSSLTSVLSMNTAGSRTTTPPNKVRWRLGGTDDPGTADKQADDLGYHIAVIKIAGTLATLWFDPPSGATPPATPFSTLTMSPITFDRILITGENSTTLHVDDIRIGNSWTAVSDPTMPWVTGVSPATCTTLGNVQIGITGKSFDATSTVTFGTVLGTGTQVQATGISVLAPGQGSAGAVDLLVGTPSRSVLMTGAFTYVTPSASFPGCSVAPSISGIARPGHALTADPGQWSPSQSTFDYEWESASDAAGAGAAPIVGAPNSSNYTVVTADLARWLRVKVTPFGKDPNSAAFSGWVEVLSGKPTAPEISAMDAVGPKCGSGSGLAIVLAMPFAWLLRRRLR